MGDPFEHDIRVRYAETDQGGVVYHANYLVYLEEARTRMLAGLGFPYHELEERGWGLLVRKAELRYRAPARYGDVLVVRTNIDRVGGASLRLTYEIGRRTPEGTPTIATATTELACVGLRTGHRPAPLPAEVRAALEAAAG